MASDALIAWINGAEAEFVPSSRALPPSSWSTLLDGSIVFQLAAVLFEGTLADGNVSSCTTPRAKFAAVVSCLEELMGGSYDGLRCVLCEAVAGEAEGESEALPATAARLQNSSVASSVSLRRSRARRNRNTPTKREGGGAVRSLAHRAYLGG